MSLTKEYLIEKRNILNEIRANNMSLQELRFFSIYLAKINSRDISTRVVHFSIKQFQEIMDFGRMNLKQINETTDSLLCKIIKIPNERGGFIKFQLFKQCVLDMNEDGEWYIEIDAHDEALPLMFDFKDRYFTYHLWNALRLKSSNQLRMYEILKQYEKIGERIIGVDSLRELIGIQPDEYPRYERFRTKVLDSCQRALKEHTDIKFTYAPFGRRGKGGKVLSLKFEIEKNDNYTEQIVLEDFFDSTLDSMKSNKTPMGFYSQACNDEFSLEEIQVIYNIAVKNVYEVGGNNKTRVYDYIKMKYDELQLQASRRNIKNRFLYLKKLIEIDNVSYSQQSIIN